MECVYVEDIGVFISYANFQFPFENKITTGLHVLQIRVELLLS